MNQSVSIENFGSASRISLKCSLTGNLMCQEMLNSISAALEAAEGDKSVNLVIIRSGVETVFSKGHDIDKLMKADTAEAKQYNLIGQRLIKQIRGMKKPVLTLVDGDCFGPAFELVLASDMVYATENSRFGFNETAYGILPGFGGTQLASKKLYETFAKYLVFTGDAVGSAELFNKGIISKVLPDTDSLYKAADDTAALMAKRSSFAVGLAKETINATADMDFDKGLLLEQNAFTFSFSSYDKTEGTTAFVEKRDPQFKDRWEDYRF